MKAVRDWLIAADQYCFGYGSATTLGVFRMISGFLLFLNFSMIGVYWESWFSEQGYVPGWLGLIWFPDRTALPASISDLAPQGLPRIDLLNGVTDSRIAILFYVVVVISALFTCLGLGTKVATFVLAVGTITLHHRNGAILHGGDTVIRLMAIYMAVSPCGRACSLDRLIGIWKDKISHSPALVSLWSQRLIGYNIALIYFTSVWLKWDGSHWRDLTATYYPERLAEFYRFPVPDFFKSLWMAKVTTIGTLAVEFTMGTLVFFPPARKYVILGGILVHSFIEYSMNIPLFSFLMMTCYIAFFEGEEISAWAQRIGLRLKALHVQVRLPTGMQLTPRGAVFLSALDPFGLVTYLPGELPSWQAFSPSRKALNPDKAIASRSLGGWLFLWFRPLRMKILQDSLENSPEPDRGSKEQPRHQSHRVAAAPKRKKR